MPFGWRSLMTPGRRMGRQHGGTLTKVETAGKPGCDARLGATGKENRVMAYQYILSERLDGVALITLNRPEKLNALSYPLVEELDRALTGYEADDDIKAVVLTGAGDRAFS